MIAAVAAIAEHSIARQFAAGRPDAQDAAQLAEFAQQIQQKLLAEDASGPLSPAIVLINKPEVTAWHPRQQRIVSPAVHAPRRAPFALSTRVTPNEQLARRASPACAASPYVREVLASLIPTNYPLFPRC